MYLLLYEALIKGNTSLVDDGCGSGEPDKTFITKCKDDRMHSVDGWMGGQDSREIQIRLDKTGSETWV